MARSSQSNVVTLRKRRSKQHSPSKKKSIERFSTSFAEAEIEGIASWQVADILEKHVDMWRASTKQ
jgi:hypothetical protein